MMFTLWSGHRRATWALVAMAAVAGALVPLAPEVSRADTQDDIRQRIEELREQVGEASQEETALLDQLAEAQVRLAALDAVIGQYDSRISDVSAELDRAEARVAEIRLELATTELQLADTENRLDATQLRVDATLVELYTGSSTSANAISQYTEFLIDGAPLDELGSARVYLELLGNDQERTIDQLAVDAIDSAELAEQLDRNRRDAEEVRDVVATRRAELQVLRAEQAGLRDEVLAQQRSEQQALDALRADVAHWKRDIEQLEAESRSITAFLVAVQRGQRVAQAGNGSLHRPVPGAITSGYGRRLHPILNYYRTHTGADFHAASGTPIEAAASGAVVWAGARGGYGNCVIIDHGNGLATLYAHQSRLAVSDGDTVKAGEVIGYVGSTGLSTGPHLHFEVRRQGEPVNPVAYL